MDLNGALLYNPEAAALRSSVHYDLPRLETLESSSISNLYDEVWITAFKQGNPPQELAG
eukprot:CAMPEP_0170578360 /NCGR_PEP_ID=MMETSP0224-20130122/5412_1 /TAXON_ID=285029 /ORGANISM="Togula jolla, Strain CCCM 725" /LENGTH=58 /DNA_ID=CAMNT_0010901319 /DNA_START=1449 /DNA_END=1625 /DNA_ORIENTATION=-